MTSQSPMMLIITLEKLNSLKYKKKKKKKKYIDDILEVISLGKKIYTNVYRRIFMEIHGYIC